MINMENSKTTMLCEKEIEEWQTMEIMLVMLAMCYGNPLLSIR